MALARLALRNLQQRVCPSSSYLFSYGLSERTLSGNNVEKNGWACETVKRFSVAADDQKARDEKSSEGGEVAVQDKKSKLVPRKQRKRGLWRKWRDSDHDPVPALQEVLPSGLGNALMQVTENMNKLLQNLAPSRLLGRLKEEDQCYKLKYVVPGLKKEDLKITVEDGFLIIRGEHKEEDEEGEEEIVYYNATLSLPEDAKTDEIKAELNHGVLTIVIPRTERPKKDVKEVPIE